MGKPKKKPYAKITIIVEDENCITTYHIPQAKGFQLQRFSIPTRDFINLTFVKDLIDVGIKFRASRGKVNADYITTTIERKVMTDA